jgi:hypothetical protein
VRELTACLNPDEQTRTLDTLPLGSDPNPLQRVNNTPKKFDSVERQTLHTQGDKTTGQRTIPFGPGK